MMDLLPPVGWRNLATKADLKMLGHDLDARISRLETSLTKSFVTWLLVSQATVVALNGILVGALVAFT